MNDKFQNSNDRVLEIISDIEKKFASDINSDLIHDLFELQAIVAVKISELQNETLSSVIFWMQEGKAQEIQSYYILAKKLFNALKKELKDIDFRSSEELPIKD